VSPAAPTAIVLGSGNRLHSPGRRHLAPISRPEGSLDALLPKVYLGAPEVYRDLRTTAHVNHPFTGSQGRDGKGPPAPSWTRRDLHFARPRSTRPTCVSLAYLLLLATQHKQTIAPATHDLCHFINACTVHNPYNPCAVVVTSRPLSQQ
jgi:hypothetical protein